MIDADLHANAAISKRSIGPTGPAPPWRRFAVRSRRGIAVAITVAAVVSGCASSRTGTQQNAQPAASDQRSTTVTSSSSTVSHEARTVDVGDGPCGVAVAGGRLWVTLLSDNAVVAVDPATGSVGEPVPVPGSPCWVTADGESIWVTPSEGARAERRDAATGAKQLEVDLGATGAADAKLAVAFDDLWATVTPAGEVVRINRDTGAIIARIPTGSDPRSLIEGGGLLWVANETSGTIVGIEPATNAIARRLPLDDVSTLIAYSQDSLWVSQGFGDKVLRVDPADGRILDTRTVGGNPQRGVVVGTEIWIPNHLVSTMSIVATTSSEVRTLAVGRSPSSIVQIGDEMWIANYGDGTVSAVSVIR